MNGFLLVDKDQDWTSSDVVAKLRGVLKERRIGHAGTLDPMATGLLLVMVGKCTKASDALMHQDKEYLCTLRLGTVTDTQDIWGRTVKQQEVSVSKEELLEALKKFTGTLSQIPPMYSAVKIKGERLYKMAYRGEEIAREPRTIQVYAMELESFDGEDAVIKIRCSSGTYVRTLCHDIGEELGCGGCMAQLRRTAIGDVSVDEARKIADITGETELMPPDWDRFHLPEKLIDKITGI